MSYFIQLCFLFSFIYSQCDYDNESLCINNVNEDCEWIEDIQSGSCSSLSGDECNAANGCSWDYECIEYGWWYNWCYTYGYECNGGSYTIDNGYCQEVEEVECSSLDENSCNHPLYGEGCNWVEDITEGSCYYGFNNYSDCIANGCYWYNPGTYGYMGSHCYGGTYTIDNSYCEELENQQGDLNGDSSVDVLDVIQTIDLIISGYYNIIVDMDYNGEVNILDIIQIIDIIVNQD